MDNETFVRAQQVMSPAIINVVRGLPQWEEVYGYASQLSATTSRLQLYPDEIRRPERRPQRDNNPKQPLRTLDHETQVSALIWTDLQLAQGERFPQPTMDSLMYITSQSKKLSRWLVEGYPAASARSVEPLALSLTGLHHTILGRRELIDSDPARRVIDAAAKAYRTQFIRSLLTGVQPPRQPRRPRQSNMFTHVRR